MLRVLVLNLIAIFLFAFVYLILAKISDSHFTGLDKNASFIDAVYFSFTVQSTVGFGDISPKSKTARTFVMMQQTLLIVGVVDLIESLAAPRANKVSNTSF